MCQCSFSPAPTLLHLSQFEHIVSNNAYHRAYSKILWMSFDNTIQTLAKNFNSCFPFLSDTWAKILYTWTKRITWCIKWLWSFQKFTHTRLNRTISQKNDFHWQWQVDQMIMPLINSKTSNFSGHCNYALVPTYYQ